MNLIYLIPEVSFFFFLTFYMISFFFERHLSFLFFFSLQICLFIALGLFYLPNYSFFFNSSYSLSGFGFIIKLLLILFFSFFLVSLYFFFQNSYKNKNLIEKYAVAGFFEYSFICFLFILSSFFFISVNDMLYLYIFLELQSLCLYVLAAFAFESYRSSESSLKYFFFGVQFSGLFLLGWLFLFYTSGLSNLYDFFDFFDLNLIFVQEVFADGEFDIFEIDIFWDKFMLGSFGLFFLVLSLFGKLGLFPLHFWMIDVYDGSSNISVFFFSVFPKVVILSLLVKLHTIFESILVSDFFGYFYFFIALGSIFFGSISNFSQWKVKRFMAYSSMVNVGYIMLFFLASDIEFDFFVGVFINVFSYIILIFSFFFLYNNINYLNREIDNITGDFNEFFLLKNSGNLTSFLFTLLMLSFAGIPPLLGFFGKYYLLVFLMFNSGFIFAFFLLLGSLLSCFYYIRIARTLFNFNTGYYLLSKTSGIYFFFIFFFFFFQIFFLYFFNNYFDLFQLFFNVYF